MTLETSIAKKMTSYIKHKTSVAGTKLQQQEAANTESNGPIHPWTPCITFKTKMYALIVPSALQVNTRGDFAAILNSE